MRRHIVPRIRGPIVVQATLVAAVAVILTSGLAFLGFGVQVPAPSWGTMVAEAASQYQQQSWFLVPTGGIIALTVLSLGLLGDALRDAAADQWTGGPARRAGKQGGPARPRGAAADRQPSADRQPAPEAGGVLQVRDLRIDVPGPAGDITLVSGIDFDLAAGRTLAIVGESGCGKSVTARALLGIAPPGGRIAGSIRFDGAELVGARESRWRGIRGRRIAFIGQEPMSGLDPAQTIGSALTEVVRAYSGCGRKQARQRAVALLGRVRIDDPQRVARLYPHQVSGGMAQRVTIARALAGDPEILVADEPTTALDVTIQADILALLRSLQLTSQIAVLLVTHDWGVVAGLADDVLVMYAGQAVEQAAAEVVFDRPRHPYTEALLGSDPHGATPGMPLPAIAGTVPAPGHWPTGCRFADRCGYVTPECAAAEPVLDDTAPGHRTRCIHADRLEGAR
jgi:peptide/nickel transport system permease protein